MPGIVSGTGLGLAVLGTSHHAWHQAGCWKDISGGKEKWQEAQMSDSPTQTEKFTRGYN